MARHTAAIAVGDRVGAIHTVVIALDRPCPAAQATADIQRILGTANRDDWILLSTTTGATNTGASHPLAPAAPAEALRDFGAWLLARGVPVGAVGYGGRHFDRRHGRLVVPAADERAGPATLDELASGGPFMIRVGAAHEVGGFDTDLCVGLTALDYGLRLQAQGFGLYAIGPPFAAISDRPGRAPDHSPAVSAGRRYYETRNVVVLTRRYGARSGAITAGAGWIPKRHANDGVRSPRQLIALVVAEWRGNRDGRRGRLGCRDSITRGSLRASDATAPWPW